MTAGELIKDLDEIKETFEFYDTDNNGVLDRREFASLCGALGGGFSSEELDIGFREIDSNKNGVIELEEFCQWWIRQ